MPRFALQARSAPGLRFKIVSLDKSTMKATLQGDTGVPFERVITQAELDKYGYDIVKVEEPPANAQGESNV